MDQTILPPWWAFAVLAVICAALILVAYAIEGKSKADTWLFRCVVGVIGLLFVFGIFASLRPTGIG